MSGMFSNVLANELSVNFNDSMNLRRDTCRTAVRTRCVVKYNKKKCKSLLALC